MTRILLAEEKSRNWIKLAPMAMYVINSQISSRTGYAQTKLFLRHPDFYFEMPTAKECNTKVNEWLDN